jgi:hypothetical protein
MTSTSIWFWKLLESVNTSATDNLGCCELKQQKALFNDEYSKLSGQWKQPKLQWLQNPSQANGDNMNHFKTLKYKNFQEHEEESKISNLEANSKNKSVRDL